MIPIEGFQLTIIFGTALPFITTIFSKAAKSAGGVAGAFNTETFLTGNVIPDSIFAYLPSIYGEAVIT